MNLPIQPTPPPLQTLSLSSRLVDTLALKPGQLIEAEVVSVRPEQVTLKIGDQLLTARSERPLAAGQHYTLRVQFSQGQWQLIPQPSAQGTATSPLASLLTPAAQPVATALTQVLQQIPLSALPASLQPLVQQLRQHLIAPDRLSGKTLEKAVNESGLFFENRLAATRQPPQDIKSTLLKLLAEAQEKEEALVAPIRAMLRHIGHHQARTLSEQHLVVPLLFAPDSGVLQGTLVIEPDADTATSADSAKAWRALLELDFDKEGTLQLGIQLLNHSLTLQAWSDHPFWQPQLEQHLSELKAWMAESGFEVAALHWQQTPLLQPAAPKVSIKA
ncbi:hypothetical protein SAMN05443662_0941 [Sulfurivirga caldicuralii]|uniref:Hook-length control protein FliK n=1 Tax=Sulfurivirga caldicuralii TaxID=364032 RepID=A0A1N6F6L7_9GAMM|nr:hypothetical protein [Sulfurivirga caldicuralii]SIN90846.1 hypothetical protein SAMN05443662_0941 [Sulfurivirga caldicuralii]